MHKVICMTIVEPKEKFGSKLVIGQDLVELELFFLFSGKSVNLPTCPKFSQCLVLPRGVLTLAIYGNFSPGSIYLDQDRFFFTAIVGRSLVEICRFV